MNYSVALRTREIGLRLAIGAQPRQVLLLILKQGSVVDCRRPGTWTRGGVCIDASLSGLLFGVEAVDVTTFTTISLLLVFVSLLACYLTGEASDADRSLERVEIRVESVCFHVNLCYALAPMATLEQTGDWGRTAGSKLGWMIAGRLVTALLLSVIGTLWTTSGEASQSINKSLGLLTIVACLTILYALIFRLSKNILLQARFQLAVDVLLVTWLVWNSNVHPVALRRALHRHHRGFESVFRTTRSGCDVCRMCGGVHGVCAADHRLAWAKPILQDLVGGSMSQTIQWVGLFDVAFFVVGLLSARLAERQSRSDVRLAAATQSLANLRALHERIVASIRSGLVTTDLEGRIFTFNVAAQEITGYQEETIRGQDASILFGEMKEHIAETLARSARKARTVRVLKRAV